MVSGHPIPTRCVQTGQIYASFGGALRDHGIGKGLWGRAYQGYPVGPKRLLFDPISPDDPDWQKVPKFDNGKGVAVRCVETGMVYRSITAAARAVHVHRSCIYYALYKRGRAAGYHWEWANG